MREETLKEKEVLGRGEGGGGGGGIFADDSEVTFRYD